MRFLVLSTLLSAVHAFPSWGNWPPGGSGGHGPPPHGYGSPAKAAYFLDDNPSGASVISLAIGNDGTLSNPVRTSTNGVGMVAVNGTGFPNQQDPLNSQSSVVVSGNLLFTVNTGSDTAVVFRIDPRNPQQLHMIGSPVSTLGQFPMSVTYSPSLKIACVLNGGAKAGVACFNVDPFRGLQAMGGLRSIGQAIDETTPPTTPPLSASQILFTPDSSEVLALVKGNAGSTPVKPGWIATFSVQDGQVSDTPTLTSYTNVPMIFGSVWLDKSRLFASDPSFGGAIINVDDQASPVVAQRIVVPGQVAICWSAFDANLETAYLIDAGKNEIYTVNANTGALGAPIDVTTDSDPGHGPGIFDAAIQNNLFYGLGGEPGVVVVDLVKRQQIQWLDLSGYGNRQGWTGMALYG